MSNYDDRFIKNNKFTISSDSFERDGYYELEYGVENRTTIIRFHKEHVDDLIIQLGRLGKADNPMTSVKTTSIPLNNDRRKRNG